MQETQPQIQFRCVGKRFPGVVALQDVSFDIQAGACHALMGENGAGKSTLGRILAGVHRPDSGAILLKGKQAEFHDPLDALEAGVGIVHQELAFCPNLSVAENLCLSTLPRWGPLLNRRQMRQRAREFLARVGADCDVDDPMDHLSIAQEQLVQIAAVLASGASVIVMDEPTSSLSEPDVHRLHKLIGELRRDGKTIVYVSHRMDEIFRICDWITVLRDGQHVATVPAGQTNQNDLVRMMIGRSVTRYFPSHANTSPGREILRVSDLSSPGKFASINFNLRAGEVVGMAGLVGSGRSEIAEAIFGLDRRSTGRIQVNGSEVTIRNPRAAMALGIGLVPEDRKRQGLVLDMACGKNITLSMLERISVFGWIVRGRQDRVVDDFFHRLRVKAADADVPAAGLSGGNQQKLVLAKWLARACKILILDEPTRGVDIGAKSEIHRLIDELAASGCAVLMISSELPEIIHLSTRVLVVREGRLMGELSREQATQERIMALMAGAEVLRAESDIGSQQEAVLT
jgi:ABC-type sugar transport system ATPase subunit